MLKPDMGILKTAMHNSHKLVCIVVSICYRVRDIKKTRIENKMEN